VAARDEDPEILIMADLVGDQVDGLVRLFACCRRARLSRGAPVRSGRPAIGRPSRGPLAG